MMLIFVFCYNLVFNHQRLQALTASILYIGVALPLLSQHQVLSLQFSLFTRVYRRHKQAVVRGYFSEHLTYFTVNILEA